MLNARVTAAVSMIETEENEEAADAPARYRGGLGQLRAYRDFSAHALQIGGGFRTDEVPTLPPFYNSIPPPEMGEFFVEYYVEEIDQHWVEVRPEDGDMDAVMLQYSEVGAFASV